MLGSYGRITSDITGSVKLAEAQQRAQQREALVNALQQQVLEKEAKKMISRLQKWDEDQRELVLLGFAGAGKPRPNVPVELVPYIEALAPGALHAAPLPAAPAAAAAAAAAAHPAAPTGAAAALTSRAPLLPAVAMARPVPLPGAPPPGADGAEAHLDRVLRSVAPGLAEHVAAVVETASSAAVERAANEAAAAAAARVQQGGAGSAAGDGGAAGVAALAELVRELLSEQRSIRAQLEARGGGGGGGGSGGGASRGGGVSRGAPAGSAAALLRAARGGGGGGRAAPPRASPSPPPNLGSRRNSATSAARSDGFDGDEGGGGGGSLRRAAQQPKRPPFGRHAEGTLTAAERRAKGDKRLRDAAERRRLALEDFRAASAAQKASKVREAAAQKGLRRQMAFDRSGALAAAEGAFHGDGWEGAGLADVLRSSPPRSRFTDGGGGAHGGGAHYQPPAQQQQQQQQQQRSRRSLPPSLQAHAAHAQPHLADEDMDLASMLGHMPVEVPSESRMFVPQRGDSRGAAAPSRAR